MGAENGFGSTKCWRTDCYTLVENMELVKLLGIGFIMTLKCNCKVALSADANKAKDYKSIESLQPDNAAKFGSDFSVAAVGYSAVV